MKSLHEAGALLKRAQMSEEEKGRWLTILPSLSDEAVDEFARMLEEAEAKFKETREAFRESSRS